MPLSSCIVPDLLVPCFFFNIIILNHLFPLELICCCYCCCCLFRVHLHVVFSLGNRRLSPLLVTSQLLKNQWMSIYNVRCTKYAGHSVIKHTLYYALSMTLVISVIITSRQAVCSNPTISHITCRRCFHWFHTNTGK